MQLDFLLPDCGLTCRTRGEGKSTPGGLPDKDIITKQNKSDDYWMFERSRRVLSRIHLKPRNHLYAPAFEDCPIPEKRIGLARTTIMKISNDMIDLKQDNWKANGNGLRRRNGRGGPCSEFMDPMKQIIMLNHRR